jgi:hypothetical protein
MTKPPTPTRHREQGVRAPHKPRQEAADPDLEELAERLGVAQGTHHPQGVVYERLGKAAIVVAKNLLGQPVGVGSHGGTPLTARRVGANDLNNLPWCRGLAGVGRTDRRAQPSRDDETAPCHRHGS